MADDIDLLIRTRDAGKSELASLRANIRGLEKDVRAAAEQFERTGKGEAELAKLNKRLDDTRSTAARVAKEVRVLDGRVKDADQSSGKLGRTWDKLGSKVRNNAREIRNAGMVAAAGVALLAKTSIDAASNLVESEAKMQEVFGKSSAVVDAWAKKSQAFGQSKRQAIDSASAFGIFGKAAQLEGDKLAAFSIELTELASDLASFSNTSVDEAATSIGAALRGESEPIRRYGVLLDDATLRQEALALGLIKTTKEALLPQQRVLAAKSAILKQTTTAQGDFARTSDQLANSQRTLTAQWEDSRAELGQQLLPIMLTAVTIGGKILGVFGAMPGPVRTATMVIGLLGIAAMIATPRIIRLMDAIDGRRGAGTSSRALRGALGSVSSFVAGPWGLAIAGGTAALGLFAKAHADAKAKADDLATTLDQQNASATKDTFEKIATRLTTATKDSFFSKISGGLLGGQVKDSLTTEEWEELLGAGAVENLTKAVVEGGPELDRFRARLLEARRASDLPDEKSMAERVLEDTVKTYGSATSAVEKNAAAVEAGGDAYDKTATKTDALTRAQDKLKSATDRVATGFTTLDAQLDKSAAKDAAIAATNALTQSLKENGNVLKGNSDKALANRAAVRDAIEAQANYAKTIKKPGEQAKYVNGRYKDLEKTLRNAGLKPGEVNRLLRPFDQLRDKINEAKRAARELSDTSVSVQVGVRRPSNRGVPAVGDTATPKGAGVVGTAALFARHAELSAGLPGKREITSMVRNHALGSPNSDHRMGRAYDLVGDNLTAYAARVNSSGGFAEFHGSGEGRHLHVVPDAAGSGPQIHQWQVSVPGATTPEDAWTIGRQIVRGAQAEQRRVASELT